MEIGARLGPSYIYSETLNVQISETKHALSRVKNPGQSEVLPKSGWVLESPYSELHARLFTFIVIVANLRNYHQNVYHYQYGFWLWLHCVHFSCYPLKISNATVVENRILLLSKAPFTLPLESSDTITYTSQ